MISIRELDRSHNEEMLGILGNSPMRTNTLDLHFDKSPDIFAATRLWSKIFKYYGIFVEDNLTGFGMYLTYMGYVGCCPHKILYIGNFCIDAGCRKKGLLHKLAEYIYGKVPGDCQYVFCLILKGNQRAERYFDRGSKLLPFLPSKRIKIGYVTRSILILRPKKIRSNYVVRPARHEDIPIINDFIKKEQRPRFLATAYNGKSFEDWIALKPGLKRENYYLAFKNNEVVGLCAAWDISKLKRTRILRYKNGMKIIRRIYKVLAMLFNYPDLPENADAIKEVYMTDLLIKGGDHLILESLLKLIYNTYQRKQYNLINIGSSGDDPLLNATNSFFSSTLHSNIYFSPIGDHKQAEDTDFINPVIDIALI